jgi:hypothetical protein
MPWGIKKIVTVSVVSGVIVGLAVANELRRAAVIVQNKEIAQCAQKELENLRHLGFSERDIPVQSNCERLQAANAGIYLAEHKWWMISIKIEERRGTEIKLRRLLSLNHKLLKSYKHDLNDMRKYGFTENDPRVVLTRNKVAQTIVDLANLSREYKQVVNKRDFMSDTQLAVVQQMIDLNRDSIEAYKAEIENCLERDMDPQDKEIRHIRSKIAVKMAENSLLERKLHR